MPDKTGRLTPLEARFVELMAATGDPVYSAAKAGYGSPAARASQNMGNAALVKAVRKRMQDGLLELGPIAHERHKMMLLDPYTPAGAAVLAIKLVYDRMKDEAEAPVKDLSEMTADELQDEIRRAAGRLAEIGDAARDVTPQAAESLKSAQAAPNITD